MLRHEMDFGGQFAYDTLHTLALSERMQVVAERLAYLATFAQGLVGLTEEEVLQRLASQAPDVSGMLLTQVSASGQARFPAMQAEAVITNQINNCYL